VKNVSREYLKFGVVEAFNCINHINRLSLIL
jgi:hypothetical protein